MTGVRIVYTKHGLGATEEQAVQVRSPGGILRRAAVRLLADRLVAVSEAVRESLLDAGADPGRIRVIPGGVNLLEYERVSPLVPGVVGALGRLAREKGFDLLLSAMAGLKDRAPVRLLVGGDGPQREALDRQVSALGLQELVSLTGFVEHVPSFLSQIGLFVLPARSEGLGLVLVEAMASGRPVVATRVGGIPEVVVDGETGLLAEAESPGALAEAMARILADPGLAERMGRAGRRRVFEHFGASAMAARTADLYEELVRR